MAVDAHHLNLDDPAQYRICAQGVFEPGWLDMLSGVWVLTGRKRGRARVTILTGCVVDQAALLGVLEQLYSLGLPLLSVEYLTPTDRSDGGHKCREHLP